MCMRLILFLLYLEDMAFHEESLTCLGQIWGRFAVAMPMLSDIFLIQPLQDFIKVAFRQAIMILRSSMKGGVTWKTLLYDLASFSLRASSFASLSTFLCFSASARFWLRICMQTWNLQYGTCDQQGTQGLRKSPLLVTLTSLNILTKDCKNQEGMRTWVWFSQKQEVGLTQQAQGFSSMLLYCPMDWVESLKWWRYSKNAPCDSNAYVEGPALIVQVNSKDIIGSSISLTSRSKTSFSAARSGLSSCFVLLSRLTISLFLEATLTLLTCLSSWKLTCKSLNLMSKVFAFVHLKFWS